MKPVFISCDGNDGAGKSTLIKHIHDCVMSTGRQVISIPVLGSGELGKAIRKHLFGRKEQTTPAYEALMLAAMFMESYVEFIKPMLDDGISVILDRDISSFFTYQCHVQTNTAAKPIYESILTNLEHMGVRPDLFLLCTVDIDIANQRMVGRSDNNYFDEKDYQFKSLVAQGYEVFIESDVIKNSKTQVSVIDCNPALEVVKTNVSEVINKFINERI